MMTRNRPPPGIGRLATGAFLIALSVLVAIVYGQKLKPFTLVRRNSYIAVSNASEPLVANDTETVRDIEKRGLGLGGLPDIIPPALSKIKPGLANSPVGDIVNDLNNLVPTALPSVVPSDGLPLLTNVLPPTPLTPPPLPTEDQLRGLVNVVGNMLSAAVPPLEASSIIAAVTMQAAALMSSVQAAATDVASLANAVAADEMAAPKALRAVEGVLEGLDPALESTVQGVVAAADAAEANAATDTNVNIKAGPANQPVTSVTGAPPIRGSSGATNLSPPSSPAALPASAPPGGGDGGLPLSTAPPTGPPNAPSNNPSAGAGVTPAAVTPAPRNPLPSAGVQPGATDPSRVTSIGGSSF